ncbi:MAG TPA: 2-hydroxyacyl-CoA dehydratase family protein [Desulfosalsimonadaceae bacterium]|nr:2-hydroxyacyl-CoA dehydratase family protein [Desulfosalsimonadaceae bacterium]
MQLFHDVANHIECQPLIDWKALGRPVVGYTCSQVPAEIFHAAGILPMRLRGIETDGMDIGDAYYGPFICSFPKCLLQLAGKGAFKFIDGLVITPGCDAMRRLDECWRKAGEDYEGIIPDFFYYFDVPHKAEGHGMEWFVEEIEYLIAEIEDHFSVEITEDKLREAIAEYNRGRRLLDEIESMRTSETPVLSGSDMFAATIAGTVMPRAQYNEELTQWMASLSQSPPIENVRKRIMLVGSITDDLDLFRLIESDTDAVVAAENLCFGVRSEGRPVDEDADPISALAEHYLGESTCPRMYGRYKQRLAVLKEKIEQSHVDGVIMQNIRFCDLHGAENALFEKDLEAEGIPCLRLEREYGPMIDKGRLKLRINAFLERLGRGRKYANSN